MSFISPLFKITGHLPRHDDTKKNSQLNNYAITQIDKYLPKDAAITKCSTFILQTSTVKPVNE